MAFEFTLNTDSKKLTDVKAVENASFANVASLSLLSEYIMDYKDAGISSPGKLFLKDQLGLTGKEVSFASMEPNTQSPFEF